MQAARATFNPYLRARLGTRALALALRAREKEEAEKREEAAKHGTAVEKVG
jgi:hypothetical protein